MSLYMIFSLKPVSEFENGFKKVFKKHKIFHSFFNSSGF